MDKCKKCSHCGQIKALSCFYKDKVNPDGLAYSCAVCAKNWVKLFGLKNKEKNASKPTAAPWCKKCPKCNETKSSDLFYNDSYAKDGKNGRCKLCHNAASKQWAENNMERVMLKRRAHRKKKEVVEYNKNYHKRRKAEDPAWKLAAYLRSRISGVISGKKKCGSAVKDLGCTVQELKAHLEALFQPGMSWSNYGQWHLDHKKPLASFDLTDRVQLLQACHFSNLQPLWALDNLMKSDKTA